MKQYNDNKTPAGFNVEKMAGEQVANLIYRASDELGDAVSIMIQTYKLDNEEAEKIQKQLQIQKQILFDIWKHTSKELGGVKIEDIKQ